MTLGEPLDGEDSSSFLTTVLVVGFLFLVCVRVWLVGVEGGMGSSGAGSSISEEGVSGGGGQGSPWARSDAAW